MKVKDDDVDDEIVLKIPSKNSENVEDSEEDTGEEEDDEEEGSEVEEKQSHTDED